MKRVLLSFLTSVACIASFAQTAIKTDITSVNVYRYGALETRNGAVTLKKGENTIKLSGLSAHIVPNSIQVKGNANYTITGVKHQISYLNKPKLSPPLQAKRDSLDNAEFLLSTRVAMKQVYSEEKAMMQANRSFNGTQKALLPEDIEEMADFFRSRIKEIEYKIIEVQREESQLRETVKRLKEELDQHLIRMQQNTGEIQITLLAEKNLESPIEVSYMVNNAGWYPNYDLRSADLGENIDLVYKAKVFQATGNDWNNVMLTFSTGNPSEGGQFPTLYNWYVGLRDPISYRMNMGYAAPSSDSDMQLSTIAVEGRVDKAKSMAENVEIRDNVVQTEFVVSIPQSIPSDNLQYDVELQRVSMNAGYEYFTVPKLDRDAFLVAHVTDWMKYNLLPGESNIYFKGSFVGNGYLDPMTSSDSLTFSMGRDKGIIVKRDVIENLTTGGTMGGKRKVSQGFEISLTNTKKRSVKVKLEDQIPVKTDGQIEVESDELSGGLLNTTTGKVTWVMEIAPGETKKVKLVYTVKYPKKKVLTNF